MEVRLLAFDSLGTRSMATVVETGSGRILIDPGAALGPRRYGLPPHPIEKKRLREHKELIQEESREADILIVTHYHYDHFPRPTEDISWMKEKRILLKDPANRINFSQRKRAKIFLEQLERIGVQPEVADGREFKFGKSRIKFSNPVQHGNDTRLGYVLEILIEEEGERIIHTSDVEGPVDENQLKFIIDNSPRLLICDGPMTYMLVTNFGQEDLSKAIKNLLKIISLTEVEKIVLDHHLTRDRDWRGKLSPVLEKADEKGVEIHTAASLMNLPEEPLESIRPILYEER